MLCYKDMTFCRSDCTNKSCFRFLSDKIEEDALAWTKTFQPDAEYGLVALSDFSDTCGAYQPKGDVDV